jgi:tRNA (adenine57-N1/adenine58-N1)-methyltransferase
VIESGPGGLLTIAGKEFVVMSASLQDILACIERGPQWITAKDSAQIVSGCSIGPDQKILEAGAGTGALTIALAFHVGSDGRVTSYEVNPANAKLVKKNLELASLDDRVDLRNEDVSECTEEGEYDAAVMDVPRPWEYLGVVTRALKGSGHICCYLPTMNQAERIVKEMGSSGYTDVRVLEILQRELEVGEHGTRPSFEMLGHTGYLCFGRKTLAQP